MNIPPAELPPNPAEPGSTGPAAPAAPDAEARPAASDAASVPAAIEPAQPARRSRRRAAALPAGEVLPAQPEPVQAVAKAPAAKRAPRKVADGDGSAVRKAVRKVGAPAVVPGALAGSVDTASRGKVEPPRKQDKLVRDSFTMPKGEYQQIAELKLRAAALARPAKKSELLRAGIKALASMGDTALLAALYDVPALKTGRPSMQDDSETKPKAKAGKAGERRGA